MYLRAYWKEDRGKVLFYHSGLSSREACCGGQCSVKSRLLDFLPTSMPEELTTSHKMAVSGIYRKGSIYTGIKVTPFSRL